MVIFKTRVGILPANETEISFTDSTISSDSIIEVYYDNDDVYTVESWQTGSTVHIKTSEHDGQVGVKIFVNNVTSFTPYDDSNIREDISDLQFAMEAIGDTVSGMVEDVGSLETDVGNLQTSKQDTLTAGENITIENNVISASGGSGGGDIYDTTEDVVIGRWIDGRPIKRHWYQWNSHWGSSGRKVSPLSLEDLGADFVLKVTYYDAVRKMWFTPYAIGKYNSDGTGDLSIWLNDYFGSYDQDTALIYDYVPVIETED